MHEPHTEAVPQRWTEGSYLSSSLSSLCLTRSKDQRASSQTNILSKHKASLAYKLEGLSTSYGSRKEAGLSTHKLSLDDINSRNSTCDEAAWNEIVGSHYGFPIEICDEDSWEREEFRRSTNLSLFQHDSCSELSSGTYVSQDVELDERLNKPDLFDSRLQSNNFSEDEASYNYASSSGTPEIKPLGLWAPFARPVHELLRAGYHFFAWAASKTLFKEKKKGSIQTYYDAAPDDSSSDTAKGSDASSITTTWGDEDEDQVECLLFETSLEDPDLLVSEFIVDSQPYFRRDCILRRYRTEQLPSVQASQHVMDRAEDADFMDVTQPSILHRPITPTSFEIEDWPSPPSSSDYDSEVDAPFLHDQRLTTPPEYAMHVNGDLPLTPFDPFNGVLLSNHSNPTWRHYRFMTYVPSAAISCKSRKVDRTILEHQIQVRYLDECCGEGRLDEEGELDDGLNGEEGYYGERRFSRDVRSCQQSEV